MNSSDNELSKAATIIPKLLLVDMVEFLLCLRGEWDWKENEPRGENKSDYRTLCALLKTALRYRDGLGTLKCDFCGQLHPDDQEGVDESCDCGRMFLRMDSATVSPE